MSTFLELQDEVLEDQFPDAKFRPSVKKWLNEGQNYITSQIDARSQHSAVLWTTSAGVAALALPDDYSHSLRAEVERDLPQIDPDAYDSLADSLGAPKVFTIIHNEIVLWPTPDGAYEVMLRYYRLPAEMVDNTDTPETPYQYDHLLVHYALVRCYQRENDYEAANYHEGQFQAGLLKMRSELHYDTNDAPTQVPGDYGNAPMLDSSTWW